jgi:hypothetical protein
VTLADCVLDIPADHQNTELISEEIRAQRHRGGRWRQFRRIFRHSMEAAKVVTAVWLSSKWREVSWTTFGVASINAAGVHSQLVGTAAAALETREEDAAAGIEVVQRRVADLERRLAQINGTVEAVAKRARTNGALAVIQDQRKARAALAGEIRTERTAISARGRAAEAEATSPP